ncbi:MAG: DMT family transporter [Candidatus Shapirobacteria bacterium]
MIGIIFAIFSAFFIACSFLSLKKSYQELPPSVGFLFDAIFGLLIWVPLAYFMGISGYVSWTNAIFFAVVSAILSEAVVFYALSRGELAITATILATYPVYTVIFSRLFNNEVLSTPVMIFVVLAILGSIIASLPDKISKDKLKINAGVMWPFISAMCIGLSDTLSKGYINRSNDFSFLFALGLVQIPVALVYLRIEKQSLVMSIGGVLGKLSSFKFALMGGLFNIVGTGFLWLSFFFAPASIASPITGASGALTVLLSRFVFKEKIVAWKFVGIVMAFVGVIGIVTLRSE